MKIIGNISLEGDKSISHRALILASMCRGKSVIKNLVLSEDMLSTINCLKATGINIRINDGCATVGGQTFHPSSIDLNCGNSGTTVRLLSGLLAGSGVTAKFIGDKSLSKRPMDRIIDPLKKMGVGIESKNGYLPISLTSEKLCGINYSTLISSAQVKSCIILAGLGAFGETQIQEKIKSKLDDIKSYENNIEEIYTSVQERFKLLGIELSKETIETLGVSSIKDIGKIMGTLKQKYSNSIDFSKVNTIVKGLLNQ